MNSLHASALKTLHRFNAASGYGGPGEFAVDSHGVLYGVASSGGSSGDGAVFSFDPSTQVYTVLHQFTGGSGDGAKPYGRLVFDGNGNLYGVTSSGGSLNYGVVFQLNPATGAEAVLHSFDISGGYSSSPLVVDSAGDLFGANGTGGAGGGGNVYRIDGTTHTETVVLDCQTSGTGPISPLNLAIDVSGNLYGTSDYGGELGKGSVYELDKTSFAVTILHSFDNNSRGGYTVGGDIVVDADGTIYGTSHDRHILGNVYRLRPATNDFQTIYQLSGVGGYSRVTDLTIGRNSQLFGTTFLNSNSFVGTVFKLDGTSGKEADLATLRVKGRLNPVPFGVTFFNGVLFGAIYQQHPGPFYGRLYSIKP